MLPLIRDSPAYTTPLCLLESRGYTDIRVMTDEDGIGERYQPTRRNSIRRFPQSLPGFTHLQNPFFREREQSRPLPEISTNPRVLGIHTQDSPRTNSYPPKTPSKKSTRADVHTDTAGWVQKVAEESASYSDPTQGGEVSNV